VYGAIAFVFSSDVVLVVVFPFGVVVVPFVGPLVPFFPLAFLLYVL
jgi:hypothetical protein